MAHHGADQGPPTSLRGWLSDVCFPALEDPSALVPFVRRLGERATVADPSFGVAKGTHELDSMLAKLSGWLRSSSATYKRLHFTMGIDRDVTEGLLAGTHHGKGYRIPVAVVSERKRAREVSLRIYRATTPFDQPRASWGPFEGNLSVASMLSGTTAAFLDALRSRNLETATSSLSEACTLFDPFGQTYGPSDLGSWVRSFAEGVIEPPFGAADDGRSGGVECVTSGIPTLLMLDREETGLVKSVRAYVA